MRMQLPETARRGERRLGGIVTSVAAHGVVILLVVYASAHGAPPPAPPAEAPAPIIYTAPMRPAPVPVERRADPRGGTHGATAPALPAVPPIVPSRLPPITLPMGDLVPPSGSIAGDPVTWDGSAVDLALSGAVPGDRSGADGPLGAHEVERAAAPRTRIEPRYPESLRVRGIIGAVVVRFVVDSTGRLAPGSLEIVTATEPLFADAVRTALARTRFTPAMVAGRHVPQLVEQRFEFRLGGGA